MKVGLITRVLTISLLTLLLVGAVVTLAVHYYHHKTSNSYDVIWRTQGVIQNISCVKDSCFFALNGNSNIEFGKLMDSKVYLKDYVGDITYIASEDCVTETFCAAVGFSKDGFSNYYMYSRNGMTFLKGPELDYANEQTIALSCNERFNCYVAGGIYFPLVRISMMGSSISAIKDNSSLGIDARTLNCQVLNGCVVAGTRNYLFNSGVQTGSFLGYFTMKSGWINTSLSSSLIDPRVVAGPNKKGPFLVAGSGIFDAPFIVVVKSLNNIKDISPSSFIATITTAFCDKSFRCYIGVIDKDNKAAIWLLNLKNYTFQSLFELSNEYIEINSIGCSKSMCYAGVTNQILTKSAIISFSPKLNIDSEKDTVELHNILPGKPAAPGNKALRVLIEGDSQAVTLGIGLSDDADSQGVNLKVGGLIGCGILGEVINLEHDKTFGKGLSICAGWQHVYKEAVDQFNPKVVLLLVGRWEVSDHLEANGKISNIYQPEVQNQIENDLKTAISILSSKGARVVILSAPFYFTGYSKSHKLYPEDEPQRVLILNRIERHAAELSANKATFFNLNTLVSVHGKYARIIKGVVLRDFDGVHFSLEGGLYLGKYLIPYIKDIASKN